MSPAQARRAPRTVVGALPPTFNHEDSGSESHVAPPDRGGSPLTSEPSGSGTTVCRMHRLCDSAISNRRVLDAISIAIFGLIALIFIGFAPFRGSTVGAVDVITRQTSPYVESRDSFQRSQNPLQTDQTDGIALAATFWRDIQDGKIRMWEPNLGTGAPLGGVIYTRVWSPFYWIGLIVPAQVLSSYAAWFALWAAQVGAWCLARRLGIGRIGAMLTGVAYGFSGSVTALLFRVNEAALAPWVFLAVHVAISRENSRHLRAIAGLSAAVAMTWLAGFPAGTILTLYGAGAVAVGTLFVEVGPRIRVFAQRLGFALAGVIAGTLLAAPLLLPSFEFLSASESLDRSYGSDHSAGLAMFGTSVSGRILGSWPDGTWWWPVRGYSNPVQASATVGVIVLLLLLVGSLSRRLQPDAHATKIIGRVYLPLGLVVFIGVFLGGPVLAVLHLLPFLSSNALAPSRLLLALAIALAGGNMLDGLIRANRQRFEVDKPFRVLSLAIVVAAVAGASLVAARAADEVMSSARDGLRLPLVIAGLGILLLGLARSRRTQSWGRGIAALCLIALLAVELQWGAWGFTPVVAADEGFYPLHESFKVMEPGLADGLFRFAGTDIFVIRPNSAAWLDLRDLRISNPSYERYRELMSEMDPRVFSRARLRTWFTEDLDPSSPILDRSAVRYLVAPAQQPVLEAEEAERVPISVDGSATLSDANSPARALRLEFGSSRCRMGSLTATRASEVVGHRPLWQLRDDPFEVPLEDLTGGEPIKLVITGCDLDLPETATVVRATSTTSLRLIWADDAVIYERLNARPRVEVATRIIGFVDPEKRLRTLAESQDTGTTVLDLQIPLTSLAGGTATLVEDRSDGMLIEVEALAPGYVIIRDANAPGWRATVDGRSTQILHADHAYRAIAIPKGPSTIELTYSPLSRQVGLLLAGFTLFVFGFAGFLGHYRARPRSNDEEEPIST